LDILREMMGIDDDALDAFPLQVAKMAREKSLSFEIDEDLGRIGTEAPPPGFRVRLQGASRSSGVLLAPDPAGRRRAAL